MKYTGLYSPASVPQSEPLPGRSDHVPNSAGGYVFALDRWARLDRFLVLGSDAPTYYASAARLTQENALVVDECWAADPLRTAARIVGVSVEGRAPKNDPAIFALALGSVHPSTQARRAALRAVGEVCRTGTHLFQFVRAARHLGRGWGRAMKRAVAQWYDDRTPAALAWQVVKYRQRGGYDHARLVRTAHPSARCSAPRSGPAESAADAVYRWILGRLADPDSGLSADASALLPDVLRAHVSAMAQPQTAAGERELVRLVRDYHLPWEALPTWASTRPAIWQEHLPHMGLTALVRNLGNMTRLGAIAPLSAAERLVVERLGDREAIRAARLHPFAILLALSTYASGRGVLGTGTWEPSQPVLRALDAAFYAAFENVVSTGRRIVLALDVSGSMGAPLLGSPLTCRAAAAALALVALATEERVHVVGFTSNSRPLSRVPGVQMGATRDGIVRLDITAGMRLDAVVRYTSSLAFGGTDCALPILYATEQGIEADAFVVLTDNQTWAGRVHPCQALRAYRHRTGIPAKMVVVAMTSTGFSVADPADAGMLDVVGFDAACPALVADFIRGDDH